MISSGHPDLLTLLKSWIVALQADHKSASTIESYTLGVELFCRWCDAEGMPSVLDRATVRAWIAHLLASGQSPATARSRQMACKRFSAWLAEEDEIEADELAGLKPPKLDEKVVDRLGDDEVRRMLAACTGKDYLDVRDTALVQVLAETGLRASELLGLTVEDVDLRRGLMIVQRGKGGKGRIVPFGPQTARALDKYLRARRKHPKAHAEPLWLGGGGQGFGYHGLDRALKVRAEAAKVNRFTLHRLRHCAAQRWLDAGGKEQGAMAVFGWRSRSMLDRYTKASAADRAVAESRSLNLGEFS